MNKKDFKKLKPGKKIYIVELDDYCECPMCDGSCNEPSIRETVVSSTDLKNLKVYAKTWAESTWILPWDLDEVFTRKKDAERKYRELEKNLGR